MLLREAGLVQIMTKSSNPDWGKPLIHNCNQSFGDDPKDQAAIRAGMRYHDMHQWRPPMQLPGPQPLP